MKIELAALTTACAFISFGAVTAAEPVERKPAAGTDAAAQKTVARPAIGFGIGTGIGPGGGAGSASSMAGGFGSPISASGAGSQAFGGGFNRQQIPGSGPLSTGGTGTGAGAMRP